MNINPSDNIAMPRNRSDPDIFLKKTKQLQCLIINNVNHKSYAKT